MNTFSLKVIACDKVFFDGRCVQVVLPLHDGLKAIQAHHENMVFPVEVGELRILEEDGNTILGVTGTGFAEEQLRQKQSIEEYHRSKASLARAMARLKAGSKDIPLGY